MQIRDENGNLAKSWTPGSAVEREFIDFLTKSIAGKGVGIFTTQAQVEIKTREAIEEYIHSLKREVLHK